MNKFIEEILNILKKDKRLFSKDDNKLLKGELISLISKDDEKLLELLASNKEIEKRFFKKIGKITIFQKENFLQLITMNEFLPDSFTAFEVNIGLSNNKKLISSQEDISLVFPHKDCILEGGQNKENTKREEIFYNTTLAPDEVDRLKEPKVLTNWKKFDSKGEHKITDVSLEDNLIIKGNNLMALYSLLPNYRNKIKLIYIDPPYNTGNDSFKYNDSFNHGTWLTFMKNRLSFAKELLKPNGVIAIHCDDNEQSYLKNLADEVFLPHNFESTIVVKSSTPSGRKTTHRDKKILKQKDYIHIYSKGGIEKINPQYAKRIKWDTHFSRILNVETLEVYNLVEVLIKEGLLPEKSTINDIDIDNKRIKEFYLANKSTIFQTQPSISDEGKQLSLDNPDKVIKYSKNPDEFALNGRRLVFLEDSISKLDTGEEDLSTLLCDFWNDIDFQNTQNEGGISFPAGKKPEALLDDFYFCLPMKMI